jgi:hypothetical protein
VNAGFAAEVLSPPGIIRWQEECFSQTPGGGCARRSSVELFWVCTMSEHQTKNCEESPTRRPSRLWWAVCTALVFAMAVVSGVAFRRTPAQIGIRAINFVDGFEHGQLDAWQMPHPEDWEILSENGNHYLHMKRSRDPGVPRRPLQFALPKAANVGSFDFRVRTRRAGKSMIVVFNYVDTLHFYYAHFSADTGSTQPVHNGIFLVNNAPRVRIVGLDAPPALPDDSWHQIRVSRDAESGQIEVWSDVQSQPIFTVVDRTFTCGQIGIGSFDETGDFDDVELHSDEAGCAPDKTPSPTPAAGSQ